MTFNLLLSGGNILKYANEVKNLKIEPKESDCKANTNTLLFESVIKCHFHFQMLKRASYSCVSLEACDVQRYM